MKVYALLLAALLAASPAFALEKGGMADLAQIDNTCLPTSAANLMLWFGAHGYPKLILPGATPEERADRIVHTLMADTGARYDIGTEMEAVTRGLETYIRRAGYACDVGVSRARRPQSVHPGLAAAERRPEQGASCCS